MPLFILHGLFGMLDNWHKIANGLKNDYTVYTVDQRNHGGSFHDREMSYSQMAIDLVKLADHLGIDRFYLCGHSMGGKTAMQLANLFPKRLAKLVVVDIAPKNYLGGHEKYFEALKKIPFHTFTNRREADLALQHYEENESVRMFLLKNLKRLENSGYGLKLNLAAIESNYHKITGNPKLENQFHQPTLFIKGANSNYLQAADLEEMDKRFSNYQIDEIKDAGHWVHAENPKDFLNSIHQFLER